MSNPLRIVFMGTPEFAVSSLDILVKNGYNIVGVITAPDKPAGRGMSVQESAVKKYAVEKELKVLQPEKLKSSEFISELKSLHADLQIVVAFRMLPEVVWAMPPLGTFNLHASLLPDYRGAAPINHAIINGEKETGVTTFFLQHEIDSGKIILQQKVPIGSNETAGELHDKLMRTGAALVLKTVQQIETGNINPVEQPASANPKTAPKIFKENCKINFNQSTETVFNFIRGLSPYPAAHTMLQEKLFKIFSANPEVRKHNLTSGSMETDGKTFLRFATTDGFISVTEAQMEGKRKMKIEEFLKGFRP